MNPDLQPVLRGETLLLRPLCADDLELLWAAARDPLIWELHPDKTRATRAGFEQFFAAALESGSALAVIDHPTGQVIGSSRYYDWDPAAREVAIGHTFLVRKFWGGVANRELKRLMIEHAAPWADAIWFHVAKGNLRSRRAMEKIGGSAAFEGPRPLHGELIDFIYYRIGTGDWCPTF